VRPVGGDDEVPVDGRIVAATHRNLEQAVKEGRLRQDLFFRLSVVSVQVPPLRQRLDDLPVLVDAILKTLGRPLGIGSETQRFLEGFACPGTWARPRNSI